MSRICAAVSRREPGSSTAWPRWPQREVGRSRGRGSRRSPTNSPPSPDPKSTEEHREHASGEAARRRNAAPSLCRGRTCRRKRRLNRRCRNHRQMTLPRPLRPLRCRRPTPNRRQLSRKPPIAEPSEPAASPGDVTGDIPGCFRCGSTDRLANLPRAVPVRPRLRQRLRVLHEKVHQLDVGALADEWSVSDILLQDILNSLARPGRDPREDLPAPVFRRGIVKLEDLEPGMKLSGTVLNVVDFGAFVDIGLSDSGLVHISRLADRFVRDPHEVVGVGDVLTVWVVDIDKQRRRVSLTAIEPGTERPAEARRRPDQSRPRKPAGKRPAPRGHRGSGGRRRKCGPGATAQITAAVATAQKPKFVTPITKEMEEGKEPLRSFSDLMQFYQKKQTDENDPES